MPELSTQRLILRPIGQADVDALHGFWTDPAVRKYLWDNEIISKETVREIVQASEACFREVGSGLFAVELRDAPGELVGFCGLRRMNAADERAAEIELLYGILPRHWGEGLVSEAAREVLRHGFEDCGLARIVGATDTPNQRSVRVMQRLGMVFQERRRYKGLDTVFYSITPTDLATAG
ncbi:MAG: GNAT family N-acetyltransferase [Pseudomonadales bacterium]